MSNWKIMLPESFNNALEQLKITEEIECDLYLTYYADDIPLIRYRLENTIYEMNSDALE